MYVKKTITLPKELEIEAEKHLVGKRYSNLSEVIRDGIRKILKEHEKDAATEAVAELYRKGRITMRQASALLGLTLRETLAEFGKKGVYIRYGEKELAEDLQ